MGVKLRRRGKRKAKRILTLENRKNISLGVRKSFLEGRVPWNKGLKTGPRPPFTDKTKMRMSQSSKGKHKSELHKQHLREVNLGKKKSEESKRKTSASMKGRPIGLGKILSESHKQSISEGSRSGEYLVRKKLSEASFILWRDKEFVSKQCSARGLRPNKAEDKLFFILNKLYPGEWKYTGDFSFMIGSKNPDFVNSNGQKKCIELFGDYWHKGQDPKDREKIFAEYGWDTLVVWECELKTKEQLESRIRDFYCS